MADITDFEIGQGETFKIRIQLMNQDNDMIPLDITNYILTGQVRENYTTEEVAATFEFTTVLPLTSGSFYIELPSSTTSQLFQRKYVYDVNITDNQPAVPVTRRILEGGLTVRPAVTR